MKAFIVASLFLLTMIASGLFVGSFSNRQQYEPPITAQAPREARESNEPKTPNRIETIASQVAPSVEEIKPREIAQTPKQFLDEEVLETKDSESLRQNLQQRFSAETLDSNWAAEIENQTWEEFYSASMPGSELQTVECRSTLCKLAVMHESANAEQSFKRKLLANLNGRSGYFEDQIGEDGSRSTVLYRYR